MLFFSEQKFRTEARRCLTSTDESSRIYGTRKDFAVFLVQNLPQMKSTDFSIRRMTTAPVAVGLLRNIGFKEAAMCVCWCSPWPGC